MMVKQTDPNQDRIPSRSNQITLEVQISILAKLPSLTQRAIRKFERAGVSVVSVERFRNRVTVLGTLKVLARKPMKQVLEELA